MYLSTDTIDSGSDTLSPEAIRERIDDLSYWLEGEYPAVMILPAPDHPAWGAVLLGCVMGCDSWQYRKAVNETLRDASTWDLPDAKLSAALFEAREALQTAIDADPQNVDSSLYDAVARLADDLPGAVEDVTDEMRELIALRDFAEQFDSRHCSLLIHESHFEDYAREFAEDLHGGEMRDASWPFDCIDWEKAAHALRQDFSAADFDGSTYYYHS